MSLRRAATFFAGVVMTFSPFAAYAQAAQDDLHTAILSSLLADPRSAGIPPAQMKVLVDALAQQAQAQHMTAADILWRPSAASPTFANPQGGAGVAACGKGFSGYLCAINASFGFAGDDVLVPAFLFASSGLLVVVIRRMRINHRAALAASAAASAAAPPWSQPMP